MNYYGPFENLTSSLFRSPLYIEILNELITTNNINTKKDFIVEEQVEEHNPFQHINYRFLVSELVGNTALFSPFD